MSEGNFLIIDIGRSWSKGFLANFKKNKIEIEKSFRTPTAGGDLLFSTNTILTEIGDKKVRKILTASLEDGADVAKKIGADFVPEKDCQKALLEFFKTSDTSIQIIDGGSSNLEGKINVSSVGKFLTFPASEIGLENYLGNKSIRPHILPRSIKELEIEEALIRSIYEGRVSTDKKNLTLILTGGVLSGTPSISRLSLMVLDLLASGEVAMVHFDREFFLPSFGALLASQKTTQTASVGSWLDQLGAFVSLGRQTSLNIDWGFSEIQEVDLTEEEVALLPAAEDQKMSVGFQIDKEKVKYTVSGGSIGIALDSRTKPLKLAFGQQKSRDRFTEWLHSVEKTKMVEEVF